MTASRTCTILFTDLVGSTEIRTQIGDDAFDVRRRAHDRMLDEAIARAGGELVKHGGDGVMAVFASAADALACGVAVQQGAERERRRVDAPFVVRVGVSSGDVVEEDGDYHGTPVVEAARLCGAAQGGKILVADVVRVLAGSRGGHDFVPVGALDLKGLALPVVAWEVGWARDDGALQVPLRLADAAARGACVGRDAEIEAVVTAWKRAATGERHVVLVAGEPGIGKTRLASELAARVVGHGGIALHGWCDEDLGAPYQPWVQALSGFVRTCPADDLAAYVGSSASELSRLLPDLADRLPEVAPPRSLDAETERARLFDAVDAFVESVSTAQPVLVVLDDVHWADRATLVLLRRLLCSDRFGALLVLATYRDTDVDRRHPLSEVLADLRREPRVTRVALGGLDESGLAALLADRAGHDPPAEFVRVLLDETEGNPFFVEEVLAHLVETGAIYQRDGVWTSDVAAPDLGLPEGVRDVVGRRLSRLPEAANELLTVAAIVGREFDLAVVIAAGRLDRGEALDALETALRSGLVVEVPGATGRYAFSHALVRQTLSEEIGGPRRARLHWQVGEALAASREPPLSSVAYHLCEGVLAGDATRAAEAAVVAAEHAGRAAAADEARALARRAIEVLDDAGLDEPLIRCRALLLIGEAAELLQRDYAAARAAVVAAAELARTHRWPEIAARAAIVYAGLFTPGAIDPVTLELASAALDVDPDSPWRPALLAIQGAQLMQNGEFDRGERLVAESVADLSGVDPAAASFARNSRAFTWWATPDSGRLLVAADEALAGALALGGALRVLAARMSRIVALLRMGDRAAMEAEVAEVRALLADRGGADAILKVWEGSLALLDARWDDVARTAGELSSEVAADAGLSASANAQFAASWYWTGEDEGLLSVLDAFVTDQPGFRMLIDAVGTSIRARRGEREVAVPSFERLVAGGLLTAPPDFNLPGLLCHGTYAAVWLGAREHAAALDARLAEYGGQLLVTAQASLVFDAVDSLRCMLLTALGRHDQAIACAEAASVVCDRAGAEPILVWNGHRLAAALLARGAPGDRERARALATEARSRAEALGLRPDVRFAQAVLDGLDGGAT